MFVAEKLLNDYRERVEAWEKARDEWVNGGDEYSYRTYSDYERKYPRPGTVLKNVLRGVLIGLMVAVFVGSMTLLIAKHPVRVHNQQPKKPKAVASVTIDNGEKCGKFHVGDIANINYGDYEGAEVKIIGGCSNDESYQVITTKDQTLFDKGSKDEQLNDVYIKAGLTFTVNDSNNLIVIGHSKE